MRLRAESICESVLGFIPIGSWLTFGKAFFISPLNEDVHIFVNTGMIAGVYIEDGQHIRLFFDIYAVSLLTLLNGSNSFGSFAENSSPKRKISLRL